MAEDDGVRIFTAFLTAFQPQLVLADPADLGGISRQNFARINQLLSKFQKHITTNKMHPQLSPDTIDDLIYSARAGDLATLKEDLTSLAQEHSCGEAAIVSAAVDSAPESEGGTGSCLLHYPAANGNLEILNFLLQTLSQNGSANQTGDGGTVNHRNHSGNTPLHWAALNTHLDCVKALVGAGADIAIKNDAGLDAVFLAERAAWSAADEGQEEVQENGEGEESKGKMSPGREVVEWLLSCENGEDKEENGNGNEAADSEGR